LEQFLLESIVLAGLGGLIGVGVGMGLSLLVLDSHGTPIPTSTGRVPGRRSTPLAELPVGGVGRIARVWDADAALPRYLAEHRIGLGGRIEVVERVSFGGPLIVRVGTPPEDGRHSLGTELVDAILVQVQR
jgi:DtxR family transcriptional regulator, Mn-dependent transcriptional regulator